MKKETQIEEEQRTVGVMIGLFCQRKHRQVVLCEDCQRLLAYAYQRLDHCKFGNDKPTCSQCTVHCYKPAMREQMCAVMRFSGPRMLFTHPIMAMRHLVRTIHST